MWISVNSRIPIVDFGIFVKTEVGSTYLPIRKKGVVREISPQKDGLFKLVNYLKLIFSPATM